MHTSRIHALSIFLLTFNCALSQETHLLISGKVLDNKGHVPIPYANIGIRDKGIGTVSNESGEFEFFVPLGFLNDSLFVSHLGYKTFNSKVNPLKGALQNIYLEETAIVLSDIVITDNSLTAAAIIRRVKKNVRNNYPLQEYRMAAFFREIRSENDICKSLLEAAVSMYDDGYHKLKSDERVYLHQVRTSVRYMNEFNADFWNGSNLFRAVLSLNAPRHPEAQSDLLDEKTIYQLTGISQYMDKPVYVLVSDTSRDNSWSRKIYVDTSSYAIYRSEAIYLPNDRIWKVGKDDSVSAKMTFGESIQDYKMINGKLYLHYIKHHVENIYLNTRTKTEIKKFKIQQYLLVNDITTENFIPPDAKLRMKNYSLQSQVNDYNPEFWRKYNMIKKTPLEKKVVEDLEREQSLETQFAEQENQRGGKKKKR